VISIPVGADSSSGLPLNAVGQRSVDLVDGEQGLGVGHQQPSTIVPIAVRDGIEVAYRKEVGGMVVFHAGKHGSFSKGALLRDLLESARRDLADESLNVRALEVTKGVDGELEFKAVVHAEDSNSTPPSMSSAGQEVAS
jgi:hypothetical protein